MRITTTAVLAGIVLVLAGVIHFVNKAPAQPVGGGIGNFLARFEPKAVDTIVIKQSNGSVSLKRQENGHWHFVEPVQDRANLQAVATLLDQLNHLAILDEIDRSEIGGTDEITAAEMGLDAAGLIRVELSGEGNEDLEPVSETMLLGSEAGIQNAIYARLPDSEKSEKRNVFVVDGNPSKYLKAPTETLRDPRLLSQSPDRLVKIVLTNAQGKIALQRNLMPQVTAWGITHPFKNVRANEKLLESLSAGLGSIQVVSVLEDGSALKIPNPIPDDSLAIEIGFFSDPLNEAPTRLFLKPHYKDGKMIESSEGVPILEASISDRPARFLVQSDLLDTIPQTSDDFRDMGLIRVNPLTLQQIIIQSRTQAEINLRSQPTANGLLWKVKLNGVLQPANHNQIRSMLDQLNQAETVRFVSDSQALLSEYGLAPPAIRVTFRNYRREGQAVEDTEQVLLLGRSERSSEDAGKLFACFAEDSTIMEVPTSLQSAIPTHISNWKGLKIFNFSEYHLREITRIRMGEPTVTLKYDVKSANEWTFLREGEDLSKKLDKTIATTVRRRLGNLEATRWVVSLADAYAQLKNQTPPTTFKIKAISLNSETGEEIIVEHTLDLAPTANGAYYYGQVDDSPDPFFIDAKTYRELTQSLLLNSESPR